ncbi:DUF4159 domain-containing protein [Arenibaculum pallidiluteum]|uniref:DUF4159 domain-containing protein n=1 Tax=Arenibaculum pallidiluteum TaxID=2812559 RepID=UPI001A9669BB|nr:DUF4159 domain-containing protein [Arenibaculum pallidiluteum]
MLSLGPLAFMAPWVLAALLVLPVLWWLLRLTPPSPRVIRFPAIRLLRDLISREETPARTPWWLLLLRLVLAGIAILALAQPVLNPRTAPPGTGPLVLVVDNGWGSGRDWPARQRTLGDLLDGADRAGRPVVLVPTAAAPGGEPPGAIGPVRAGEARRLAQTLEPRPWPSDRRAALESIRKLQLQGSAYAVWLSDGLDGPEAAELAETLQRLGGAEVLAEAAGGLPRLLLPPSVEGAGLTARVLRAAPGPSEPVTVRAAGGDGRILARETAAFGEGRKDAELRLELPAELRNEVARLSIEGESTAGGTVLLDERWRRRPVGLVAGRSEGSDQPLLNDLYYLDRALSPFSEVRRGTVGDLLGRDLSVLILADVGALTDTEADRIEAWVRRGGVLVRFAGPRLAQHADRLVPARLRVGDRTLGGALSWSNPLPLAPFPEQSPFAGLPVPPDVTVARQVLAEPTLELAERTWARLSDGTPLVTAAREGEGRIVLVHTTANPDWSNLALSGLFVQMLQRVTALSAGVAEGVGSGTLEPVEVLDGLGRLIPPPSTVFPLPAREFGPDALGPRHPPGFYGTDEARRALNLTTKVTTLDMLRGLPAGVSRTGYAERGETPLQPWLLGIALALAVFDLVLALLLRGLLGGSRVRARRPATKATTAASTAAALALLALPMVLSGEARAQDPEAFASKAAGATWLGYVVTGDGALDEMTRAGLEGLSRVLNQRTAAETAGAMAVNLELDELNLFPLLYWAVSPSQPRPSDDAISRLNAYLRNGGMILFDTRDGRFGAGGGPGGDRLQELVEGLDVPALAPAPPEHVLTKSFYLLQDFPGRYAGGEVWVEAREGRINDGVTSVVVGGNDWAGAWAVDGSGRPLNAVVPGGERQREMAYRFGVNLVMYVLTGNYKADQVHVPAILERLGQ